jgi:hypothetical protein
VFILDASIERIERRGEAYAVHLRRSDGSGSLIVEADEVIAATGFVAPLLDLPALGVATFGQSRLPAQTPWWESASAPGIYFAGTINQGAPGLKKYGIPSNSGAVQGYRYNAWLLAERIAETRFGWQRPRPAVRPADVCGLLLDEASNAPELWNQRSYHAHVVSLDPSEGPRDDGIVPLAHFVDAPGSDAVAIAVESNEHGVIRPALYIRRRGKVDEVLLEPDDLNDFRTAGHRRHVDTVLEPLLR